MWYSSYMKIHLITVDDWVAVYKDGEQVWSNHSCPLAAGLEALGIEFTEDRPDEEEGFDEVTWSPPDSV